MAPRLECRTDSYLFAVLALGYTRRPDAGYIKFNFFSSPRPVEISRRASTIPPIAMAPDARMNPTK
jgi:hypothetical protein